MSSKKKAEKTIDEIADDAKPVGPLTVDQVFDFLEARKASKAQIIRVTGAGRLDAAINVQKTGNFLLLIEVDPISGTVV